MASSIAMAGAVVMVALALTVVPVLAPVSAQPPAAVVKVKLTTLSTLLAARGAPPLVPRAFRPFEARQTPRHNANDMSCPVHCRPIRLQCLSNFCIAI